MILYHSIPTHICQFPVEILSRIFEIGTHGSDDQEALVDFPLQVSAVNKYFRAVACSTPRIWTTINFYSPRPPLHGLELSRKYEYSYPRDQLWLERSRACSIDLLLNFRDPLWNFNETCHYFRREHMERVLTLIAPHSHRIRRFTVACDTFAPIHAALLFLYTHGEKMKCLETLELYRCNEYVAEYPKFYPSELAAPIPLLGGSVAPMLTRVCLAGVHVDWARSLSPLRGLQTLELSYHSCDVRPSLIESAAILRSSPELTSLSIIGSGAMSFQKMNSKQTTVLPRMHLSSPTTLKIGYYGASEAMLVLNFVDTRLITELTLHDLSRPSENDREGGSSILNTLSLIDIAPVPKLRTLTMNSVKATSRSFANCLMSCPLLTTLTLDSVSGNMPFVLALPDSFSPQKPLCPALKNLSLRLIPGLVAGSIAKARDAEGLGLETLSVYFADAINQSEHELRLARKHSNVVTIFGEEEKEIEELSWDECCEDPYAPGGAFNDPEFDAMFF